MIFLIHSCKCGYGTFLCRAPVAIFHGLAVMLFHGQAVMSCRCCCSWKSPLAALVLERELAQLPGRRAVALGSAGDVGRAALMDSFCHMESHLWLSSLCFCMLQSSHFPNTPYIQVLILHISKPYCWFVLPQLLYKGSDFLDLCLMGFFLGLADFRPHLLNISFPTCTFQWLKILFTEVGCFSLHILHSILSICLL